MHWRLGFLRILLPQYSPDAADAGEGILYYQNTWAHARNEHLVIIILEADGMKTAVPMTCNQCFQQLSPRSEPLLLENPRTPAAKPALE